MALKDVVKDIEGYREIRTEIEILKKYGVDYTAHRGVVDGIISSLHPKKVRLRVSEIRQETNSTKTFRTVAQDGFLPPFQAGQYINVFVDAGGVRTSRPYSISSSPTQLGYYDITVRSMEDGFVSSYFLEEVKVGDSFESTAPSGNFCHNPLFHGEDLVFLAGGSGITPFMSMIREVADRGLSRRIHLIYGSRDQDDVIFHDELKEITGRHGNIALSIVISDPSEGYQGVTGFITAELIKDVLGDLSGKMFYLCGPDVMYSFCLKELEKLGIKKRKIRTEVYGPPKDITRQPGWPGDIGREKMFMVRLKGGRNIQAKASEPLMVSLERAGLPIPALCRSGECSLCRTKLLSGRVFQPDGVRLRKSDRVFGYIHPCMAYPLSDLEILL
ncbi:MAG TPA: FAD-binding oxidoreductase [Desulfomonilia bacterium]|nr:FAD-binding oxidoreductase [Desulfomonilia bacterium]